MLKGSWGILVNKTRVDNMMVRAWRKMAKGQVVLCTPVTLGKRGSLNAARRNVYSPETINNCVIITDTQHMQKQAGVVIDYDAVVYVLSGDLESIPEECRIIAGSVTYKVKHYGEDDTMSHLYNLPVRKIEMVKVDETVEFPEAD
jgi:hypothetical protein